jgi:2-iminobutanoate/2-iminopropanoate deaminase
MNMTKKKVETEDAPKAIGPYSQAVAAGQYLFVSGQIPIDPKTGRLVEDTIEAQTKQVLDNIEAILKAAGLSFEDVIRTEVFLKDMQEFQAMNAIYAERFSYPIKPARQAFQVAKLPMDVRIEISCIAFLVKN